MIEVLVILVALLWAWIFVYFSYRILSVRKEPRRLAFHEYDFWDDVDGGTYVTMPDGQVRLDNNGIVKVKIERIRTNAGTGERNPADD